MAHDVFISYSTRDKITADAVVAHDSVFYEIKHAG